MKLNQGTLKFINAGLPMLIFTFGSYLALAHILKDRYFIKDSRSKMVVIDSKSENSSVNLALKREYEKTMSRIDIDNYENKPVPRPEY